MLEAGLTEAGNWLLVALSLSKLVVSLAWTAQTRAAKAAHCELPSRFKLGELSAVIEPPARAAVGGAPPEALLSSTKRPPPVTTNAPCWPGRRPWSTPACRR